MFSLLSVLRTTHPALVMHQLFLAITQLKPSLCFLQQTWQAITAYMITGDEVHEREL
jgi:hypothetical protein